MSLAHPLYPPSPQPIYPWPKPPRPHPFPPPPRRLPQGKRMTIALGILASDGVVIAADTELSWGEGYRKSEGAKIAVVEEAGLAIAGAGDYGLIEALSHELQQTILARRTVGLGGIRQAIKANITRFYRDHVLPWKDPAFDLSLLIGLERMGRRALWVTHRTTMRPCVCAAIGAGSAEADTMFVDLFSLKKRPLLDLDTARLIAGYITHIAKDRVPGCGKNTDVVLIAGGKAEQLSRGTVGLLEQDIAEFLELQNRLAQFALGYLHVDDEREAAGHLAKFFLAARKRYRETMGFRLESERWTLGYPPGRLTLVGDVFVPKPTPLAAPEPEPKGVQPAPRRSTRGRKRRPPSRG